MGKALVVGIENYQYMKKLYGCVNDARSVYDALSYNDDGSLNLSTRLMIDSQSHVETDQLRAGIEELFGGKDDLAVFYFSGHGHIAATGGYLCTGLSRTGNDGLALNEVVTLANQSENLHRFIILDCCHSGAAGQNPLMPDVAEISEGVTILTASTAQQYSVEEGGAGLFTGLLVDALKGAAANLLGEISAGSLYAHIDQSLGSWGQRPTFKTNVRRFISLRKALPPIELAELRRISEFFPSPGVEFPLSPEFEPHRFPNSKLPPPDSEKTAIFSILQKYNRLNLLVPVGAQNMYNAAIQSKSCLLTPTGEHYRNLAAKRKI